MNVNFEQIKWNLMTQFILFGRLNGYKDCSLVCICFCLCLISFILLFFFLWKLISGWSRAVVSVVFPFLEQRSFYFRTQLVFSVSLFQDVLIFRYCVLLLCGLSWVCVVSICACNGVFLAVIAIWLSRRECDVPRRSWVSLFFSPRLSWAAPLARVGPTGIGPFASAENPHSAGISPCPPPPFPKFPTQQPGRQNLREAKTPR